MYKKKKTASPDTILASEPQLQQQTQGKQSNRYGEYETQQRQEALTSPPQESGNTASRKDNFFNLFGETLNEGNLDYINKMLAKNKSSAPKDTKKKPAGHQRTKSSNVDVAKEAPPAKTERAGEVKSLLLQDPQGPKPQGLNLFGKTVPAPEQKHARDMYEEEHNPLLETPKLDMREGIPELDMEDNNSVEGSVRPIEKEERLFFDQDDGKNANLIKKSISMDDLRKGRKQAMGSDEEDLEEDQRAAPVERGPSFHETRTYGEGRSFNKQRAEIAGKDFMDCLDMYINYFQNNQFDLEDIQTKGSNAPTARRKLEKELQASQNEVRTLKQYIEKLEVKFNDLNVSKKMLLHDLNAVRVTYEETRAKVKPLEQENSLLKTKLKEYKMKLNHTQELLAKEKIDNENSLLALKKVLYNNHSEGAVESKLSHLLNSKKGPKYRAGFTSNIDENFDYVDPNSRYMEKPVQNLKAKEGRKAVGTGIIDDHMISNPTRFGNLKGKPDPRYYDVSMMMNKQQQQQQNLSDEDDDESIQSDQSSDIDIAYENPNPQRYDRNGGNNYFQKHFDKTKQKDKMHDINVDTSELLTSPNTNFIFQSKGSQAATRNKMKFRKNDELHDYGTDELLPSDLDVHQRLEPEMLVGHKTMKSGYY